ncbi:MAG: N-acetyltransferase [Caldilineales bacterium]|nr:N-acetyltransferase [Caldilineales bacterium]MDW8317941.1 N-acetyltransferase [Anaerolineae bacterium]
MSLSIRPAQESDIPAIVALVNYFADQNLMLHRSESQVWVALHDFVVAEMDGRLVGCGSLIPLTPTLAEIRSLAVAPEYQGHGIGGQIVGHLIDLARRRGLEQVCALTLRPNFFQHQGFQVVDRWSITPKIWSECVFCPKFHRCDEVAVLMNLTAEEPAVGAAPWWRSLAQRTPLPVLQWWAARQT